LPIDVFGDFELDTSLYQLRRGGEIVDIGPRVFDVLSYLIRHRDRLVSKDELIREVWGAIAMSVSSVPTSIAAVRKALGDDPANPVFIETHRGRGYRFICEVTEISDTSPTRTPGGSVPGGPAREVSRSIFVGRDSELAALYSAFERALSGTPQLVLVIGEPGIGKTRTIEEFAPSVRDDGAVVLLGRCGEGEGAPAFWPWVQIVRTYVESSDVSTLPAALGPLASSLLQMVPELGDRFPDLPPPPTLDADQARFRLFDAVTALLTKAATERPLVVLLDDLHRADAASLLLLQFATRELRDTQVLFVGTYRGAELQSNIGRTQILSDLAREEPTRCVQLHGLTRESIEHFIAQSSPSGIATESLVAALYDQTGGNPFFLTQIVHLLAAEGRLDQAEAVASWNIDLPGGVREAVSRQLDGLPSDTRQTLAVAAVAGREFATTVIATASGLDANATLINLEPAIDARLISPVPGQVGRFRFAHMLLRDCIYEQLPTLDRVQLHHQIGEALETLHSSNLDPHTAELAYHFYQAIPTAGPQRAITYSIQAAEWATSRLAYEDVPDHYRRALTLLDNLPSSDPLQRGNLLLNLAEAQFRAAQRENATETLREAIKIARNNAEPELLAHAALGLAPAFFAIEVGVFDPLLVSLLEEALATLDHSDSLLRAQLLARLSIALAWSHSHERRIKISHDSVAMARRLQDPLTLAKALIAYHGTLWGPSDLDKRNAVLDEIRALAGAIPNPEIQLMHQLLSITASLEQGDISAVHHEISVFQQIASLLRRPDILWYSEMFDALIALLVGRFSDAENLANKFHATGLRAQDNNVTHAYAAQLAVRNLELARTDEIINSVQLLVDQHPTVLGWRCTLAFFLAEARRYPDARREFERLAINDFAEFNSRESDAISLNLLGSTCAHLNDLPRARTLYRILSPASQLHTVIAYAVAYFGPVADRLGQLAAIMHRWDAAIDHFEFAIESSRQLGALPWLAHVQHNYARALLTRNLKRDAERAAQLIEQSLQISQSLGMPHLIQKLKQLGG
jgi:DNA-binding winged helix-turn-helix (wHTH) protein/tetratricopeptide (TPR) repeat protein